MSRAVVAVAVRPWLWRSALRFVPSRWWTCPPYLPVPPKAYREMRMVMMYGDPHHPMDAADLVAFLGWCRKFPKAKRRGR